MRHFRLQPKARGPAHLRQIDRVIMTAYGASYHAALIGERLSYQAGARILNE